MTRTKAVSWRLPAFPRSRPTFTVYTTTVIVALASWRADCYCGDQITGGKVSDDNCDFICTGDDTVYCGGAKHLSVFEFDDGEGEKKVDKTPTDKKTKDDSKTKDKKIKVKKTKKARGKKNKGKKTKKTKGKKTKKSKGKKATDKKTKKTKNKRRNKKPRSLWSLHKPMHGAPKRAGSKKNNHHSGLEDASNITQDSTPEVTSVHGESLGCFEEDNTHHALGNARNSRKRQKIMTAEVRPCSGKTVSLSTEDYY